MTHPDSLPSRSRLVAERLREMGVEPTIKELPDSTHTAADAAGALGCPLGAIASSLIFLLDGAPTLVLTSGKHRVDTTVLAQTLKASQAELAAPKEVKKITGQPIGGVSPVGHPSPLPAVVDEALQEYDIIWTAAGTPRTVMQLSFDQLVQITNGTVTAVASD